MANRKYSTGVAILPEVLENGAKFEQISVEQQKKKKKKKLTKPNVSRNYTTMHLTFIENAQCKGDKFEYRIYENEF